jgi:hypothetical protein
MTAGSGPAKSLQSSLWEKGGQRTEALVMERGKKAAGPAAKRGVKSKISMSEDEQDGQD